MKPLLRLIPFFAAALSSAQNTPGSGLPSGLFDLREIDMHYHSGLERPASMKEWVDIAVADGRKVILLMDHLELYRKSPGQYKEWLAAPANASFAARYPMGPAGHQALFSEFSNASARSDAYLFRGWEVYEGELDTGLDMDALRLADVLGWHIGPNNGAAPPNGETLIRRARQLIDLQKKIQVPMILLHPFTMRVENIERTAKRENRPIESIPVSDYRFFTAAQQRELAAILRGSSVYVEIGWSTEACFQRPNCRQAMIEDVRPLADMGVQFTVSTDAHGLVSARTPFHPETFAGPLGVNPGNTNTIIREILAIRAKAGLVPSGRYF